MSKRKAPDTEADANSILRSLDEDQANTAETKIELTHIHYEPKRLCDVQINYRDTAFHLHIVTLARDSVYFLNLFEENDTKKSPIELPPMKDFSDIIVNATNMKFFFDTIYMHEAIQYNELIADAPKYSLFPLIYLSHYFQAQRLEKNLRNVAAEFIKFPFEVKNMPFISKLALFSQSCKWTEIDQGLVKLIGNNLQPFLAFSRTDKLYWPKLNSSTKQAIYSASLSCSYQVRIRPSSAEEWNKMAKELAEQIASPIKIIEIQSNHQTKTQLTDMIQEAVLLAAVKQRQ